MHDKTLARSPAVNMGADDAYGYDSTSTQPTVIDMGQPDIGYHYYRRIADDDPITDPEREIKITFRQPEFSSSIDTENLRYVIFKPDDFNPEEIASFNYSDLQGQDVVERVIVDDDSNLALPGKYSLEAYSQNGFDSLPQDTQKVDFTVIVDPDKSSVE